MIQIKMKTSSVFCYTCQSVLQKHFDSSLYICSCGFSRIHNNNGFIQIKENLCLAFNSHVKKMTVLDTSTPVPCKKIYEFDIMYNTLHQNVKYVIKFIDNYFNCI